MLGGWEGFTLCNGSESYFLPDFDGLGYGFSGLNGDVQLVGANLIVNVFPAQP